MNISIDASLFDDSRARLSVVLFYLLKEELKILARAHDVAAIFPAKSRLQPLFTFR